MTDKPHRAIAIVGVGAILPDAPDAPAFWQNVKNGRYSISEVPPERWPVADYYDPDPKARDKSYTKIGGFVRDYPWDPLAWRLPIPPRVAEAMDRGQKWAIACTREALADYGYPERPLDAERTAVILGNAMAGDKHYLTALRIFFPEYARELAQAPSFGSLPENVRRAVIGELYGGIDRLLPEITEDTMPGELSNVIAGRVASLFNFRGPNFVCDAACASAMAAMSAAIEGLEEEDFDVAITGGIDANMSPSSYVKFCKIGALSATGTRPYAEGADGFVMGEGAALFVLKRLVDAERDQDEIYAVIRGVGGSSDGKGKGITAPNPIGQRLAVERAWSHAGLSPAHATLIEGHGTSTKVGDVVEVESLAEVWSGLGLPRQSVALGSVKSNIGHLKAAAGAAGILKMTLALKDKVLPPSIGFERPNPSIDFSSTPFYVNTELRPWELAGSNGGSNGKVRAGGVSAFGFGGTNFHLVLEEHVPGRIREEGRSTVSMNTISVTTAPAAGQTVSASPGGSEAKTPPRGALVVGAADDQTLAERLRATLARTEGGSAPRPVPPVAADLAAPRRVAIDYDGAEDLAKKLGKTLKALETDHAGMWKALRSQGVFHGIGPAPKVAFLYTGQGSQYVNMLADLKSREKVVRETFAEADRVMAPIFGRPLSDHVFADAASSDAMARAEANLRQTTFTQPAVLTVDIALTRLLAEYGIAPDMVMGHSLGEYAALVTAGCLPFEEALRAVSARGQEMSRVSVEDGGRMAAIFGPLDAVERVLATIDGYVVVANVNSYGQAVIGGATAAVESAVEAFHKEGIHVRSLPVSHAFHTRIVAPASEPLKRTLGGLDLRPPEIPIIANVNGGFYPMGDGVVPEMIEILARQIAEPVQFVQGLETLYDAGARVFIEVGPKKALHGFVENVLSSKDDALSLFTNHPKVGDETSFNYGLCGLWASGLGTGRAAEPAAEVVAPSAPVPEPAPRPTVAAGDTYSQLGHLFADFLERGFEIYQRGGAAPSQGLPVVITGAGLGLPGGERVFDDQNVARILRGDQFIDAIPLRLRSAMVDKHITRLVKTGGGGPHFEVIESTADVIKLAARGGALDLVEEFGFPADRIDSLDRVTQLAIGAGLEALCDAGIPLVMRYKTTTRGTQLPDRWGLPEELRDSTGVIFASAFPGYDAFSQYIEGHHVDRARLERLEELEDLRVRASSSPELVRELDRRIHEVRAELERDPYHFDRKFLFRVLAMGHSQFAELIGARGPNTQLNAACASTTQALGLAQDWIQQGRCRRVVVISADDVTSDHLLEWMASGFLASGAAATDEAVEEAAIPFDRRRHGMLLGMGAAALVVESVDAARERGLAPITEVLGAEIANSAFHGSRLDVRHICDVMEKIVADAEARWGIDRHEIAQEMIFVSHETYTPARGGSAQAEVDALRHVFGPSADRIVIANTKGFTGHPMAVGIEDVVAIKALETGQVPPVANFKEVDPDLGRLNLSRGGTYPVRYALRLGAGFGSQIAMSLQRWVPTRDGVRPAPDQLGYRYRVLDEHAWGEWLRRVSGQDAPELEVERRTLRVRDRGVPAKTAPAAARPAESVPAPSAAPAPAPSPTPAPAAVAPEPAPAAAEESAADPVQARVLEIVSAQTGYPADMLDPDLDLEADLGIDTVKQAETFAAIREEWDIPRDENLQLRDFPTLRHAAGFVYDRRPDLEQAAPAPTPAAAPVAEAPVVEAPAAEAPVDGDPIEAKVLEIISNQTGYPPEMLELDLDLEADLGIDTVKQAETFAAIREEWEIPRDENLQLRDFPTLRHAVGFVYDRRPDLKAGVPALATEPAVSAAGAEPAPAENIATAALEGSDEAAAAVPRRVPVAVVRPELDRFEATGIELGEGSRVVLMPDDSGVGRSLVGRLEKLGVEVLEIEGDPDREALEKLLTGWLEGGAIDGVYWLPALDLEGDLQMLSDEEWRAAVERRVKLLYVTLRTLYDALSGPANFLVTATRLGGRHGYDPAGAVAPLGGAVTGFAKTFKREKPEVLVKAVDFAPSRKTAALADRLIAETLHDSGAVEVGYFEDRRWGIGLEERPLEERPLGEGEAGPELGPETVFVVTGAAGSIVSAIVSDLAAHSGGTFHLLDLAPEPDPANADLRRFAEDRDDLKRELFERLKAQGERATPARIEKELAGLERQHAALAAIEAVRRAGGEAHYHRVDLEDAEAVAGAIGAVREKHGRVDVLIHAAGLEISHFLPDKEPGEYDLVFDVKSDGWFHLLRSIGEMPLGAAVVFSSIAGRFGNAGQSDYSAANDFLAKSISSLRTLRPKTRGVAVDWTAWGGIGMATRGSIPVMMERAGIDMLSPEAGIPIVRRELVAAGGGGELVVAQGLGALLEPWHAAGGLDVARLAAERGPMAAEVRGLGTDGTLAIEAELDPGVQPFLGDHQIGGTPVLPGVMGMEAFAEAARALYAEYRVVAVEDVDFLAPFKFYRGEPRRTTVKVAYDGLGDAESMVAICRLLGSRQLATSPELQVTTHFSGRVRLAEEAPEALELAPPPAPAGEVISAEDVYRIYFHGPAYRVLGEGYFADGAAIGRLADDLPPNHHPEGLPLELAPRLVELCFQTAGLWEMATTGKMGLPHKVERVVMRPVDGEPEGRLHAVVRPRDDGGYDAAVVDEAGRVWVELEGYRTVELPGGVEAEHLEPLRRALGEAGPRARPGRR